MYNTPAKLRLANSKKIIGESGLKPNATKAVASHLPGGQVISGDQCCGVGHKGPEFRAEPSGTRTDQYKESHRIALVDGTDCNVPKLYAVRPRHEAVPLRASQA